MSFVFPLLLGGLALAGIPVVLHLIVRHKPRTLPFPAFRFLVQKQRSNVRKLRLRQLLLLALRVLVIAALCLALARPRLLQEGLGFSSEQPIWAVLVFDTSASMDYRSSDGVNRLEEAKRRGLEVLDDLPDGSRVAVLDSADVGDRKEEAWESSVSARKRIAALKIRPANAAVTGAVEKGLQLLANAARNKDAGKAHRNPRLLCVLSDRTRGSWDGTKNSDLDKTADQVAPLYEGLIDARAQLGALQELLRGLRNEAPPPVGKDYSEQALLETIGPLQEELRGLTPDQVPPNERLQSALGQARRLARGLLAQLEPDAEPKDDRTTAFRARVATGLHRLLGATSGTRMLFVDVGMEQPVDLSLQIELPEQLGRPKQRFAENDIIDVKATVRAVGSDAPATLVWQIGGVKRELRDEFKAGASKDIPFTLDTAELKLGPGPHQLEVRLEPTNDLLPFNNVRYATFEIARKPRVLVLVDHQTGYSVFANALDALQYAVEVKRAKDVQAEALGPYQAVYLLGVAEPTAPLWSALTEYVRQGGSIGIVPAGDGLKQKGYNQEAALALMPGTIQEKVKGTDDVGSAWNWDKALHQHSFMSRFKVWRQDKGTNFVKYERGAYFYWRVAPSAGAAQVLVSYADKSSAPAVIERIFDPKLGMRGKLLLFTTPLDRQEAPWHNYTEEIAPFILSLLYQSTQYLCGESEEPNLNFVLGRGYPKVLLPPGPPLAAYALRGTDLFINLNPEAGQRELELKNIVAPGNVVIEGRAREKDAGVKLASFSVNVPPEESDLSRVPVREIESVFGADAVVNPERGVRMGQALQGFWSEPLELFPYLMVVLLLVLALENLLANKFYRQDATMLTTKQPQPALPAPREEHADSAVPTVNG